ncbi:DNA polymerase Y family protein [Sphingomonas gei]|uniref:DNA-directed DNA polymerase n=1 Tax=Sphingomonas gei TaxID=1395960 RepID=A0A4S1XG00_9SPHN|nr:DNA polymerase Y family protein [Sphingomonas gei]TGX54837.1 DNA polymerase Y family protein [Sphingomonas gei]
MQRVAALFLPLWPIERLWRAEARTATRPEPHRASASLNPLRDAVAREQEHACSVPRGGGWRPGARWAREDELGQVALPPVARQPAKHEIGRRDEAAANPFRAMPPDDGGRPAFLPELAREGPSRSKLGEESAPRITSTRNGSRIEIAAACPQAQALGLRPGMALAQARAQVVGLDIRPADPEGDRAHLASLAMALARRWTPTVAIEGDDTLFLDLTGVAHLHGGEARMTARLRRMLARLGYSARIAVADTPGAAWALAHFASHRPPGEGRGPESHAVSRLALDPGFRRGDGLVVAPGRHGPALAPLPVAALRVEATAIELLDRLGVKTIGQLAAMPRAPLVRRFGAALAARLEQASGRLPEPLHPVVPPDPIAIAQRFAEPISTADAIAHWLGTLVPRLVAALAEQGLGASRVELVAERVDGVPQRIRIGLARPSRDGVHLLRLLLRRIEQIEPGYGIDALTLHVRRALPLGPEPFTERLDEEAAPDIATLVDTLATRIGLDAMWRNRPVESDVPERSVARMDVLDPPERGGVRPRIDAVGQLVRSAALHPWHSEWPKPARLLRRPERLDHVIAELPDHAPRRFTWRGQPHRIVRADGPERIHGEWWKHVAEAAYVRDYFRVEDDAGRRYWLFRRGDGEHVETGDLSWYLHGVFG